MRQSVSALVLVLLVSGCGNDAQETKLRTLEETCIEAETVFRDPSKVPNALALEKALRRLSGQGDQESRNALSDLIAAVDDYYPSGPTTGLTAGLETLKRRCAAAGSTAFQ